MKKHLFFSTACIKSHLVKRLRRETKSEAVGFCFNPLVGPRRNRGEQKPTAFCLSSVRAHIGKANGRMSSPHPPKLQKLSNGIAPIYWVFCVFGHIALWAKKLNVVNGVLTSFRERVYVIGMEPARYRVSTSSARILLFTHQFCKKAFWKSIPTILLQRPSVYIPNPRAFFAFPSNWQTKGLPFEITYLSSASHFISMFVAVIYRGSKTFFSIVLVIVKKISWIFFRESLIFFKYLVFIFSTPKFFSFAFASFLFFSQWWSFVHASIIAYSQAGARTCRRYLRNRATEVMTFSPRYGRSGNRSLTFWGCSPTARMAQVGDITRLACPIPVKTPA